MCSNIIVPCKYWQLLHNFLVSTNHSTCWQSKLLSSAVVGLGALHVFGCWVLSNAEKERTACKAEQLYKIIIVFNQNDPSLSLGVKIETEKVTLLFKYLLLIADVCRSRKTNKCKRPACRLSFPHSSSAVELQVILLKNTKHFQGLFLHACSLLSRNAKLE